MGTDPAAVDTETSTTAGTAMITAVAIRMTYLKTVIIESTDQR
jgi:hypothetical protein